MTWLLGTAAVVFAVAAVLVVVRITRGPTMLDRAIAFDVLVAIAIGAIALTAAYDRSTDAVPIMLVATLLGFVGSVSIARFSPGSDDVDTDQDPGQDSGHDSGHDSGPGSADGVPR